MPKCLGYMMFRYLVKYYSRVSVRVFLDKINIGIARLSKEDCFT